MLKTHLGYAFAFGSAIHAETVRFAIDLSWGSAAPDGVERPVILVNGTSPGPALIVHQGDNIEFLVHNGLDTETALHFHGIEQLNTPWSDGVPGLSQKPIAIGGEWLYKWTATEYGTYWYHSHYQAQTTDGLAGPIYIHPRRSLPRPFAYITTDEQELKSILRAEEDSQLVMIGDWLHVVSDSLYETQQQSNIDLYCVQSILFNGKGAVNCLPTEQQRAALAPEFLALYANDGPLGGTWLSPNGCMPFTNYTQSHYSFQPDVVPPEITGCEPTDAPLEDFLVDRSAQWASFSIIAATSVVAPIVSIDGHHLWVYAIDGRYVEPYKVHGVQLHSAERVSVLVRLNQPSGRYTMRANNYAISQLISGFATVTYTDYDYDTGHETTGGHAVYTSPGPPEKRNRQAKRSPAHSHCGNDNVSWNDNAEGIYERNRYQSWTGPERHSLEHQWNKAESQPFFTYGGHAVSSDVKLLNTSSLIGFPNVPPAREVQQTRIFYMSRLESPWTWTVDLNASYPSFPKEYAEEHPLLYYPGSVEGIDPDLVTRTVNDTWIDLIFVVTETFAPPHPMHKHSNKAYTIGKGEGEWIWRNVSEAAAAQPYSFNFETPLLSDGFTTLPSMGMPTWLVVRYHSANPGAWMLHCHIQLHLSGGMAIALLDGMDTLPPFPEENGVDGNGLRSG